MDRHREGRQEKTEEFHTGIREGTECEDIKAMGCSSEEPSPVVPAPGINCLVGPDFLCSAKGTLGVNWKGRNVVW